MCPEPSKMEKIIKDFRIANNGTPTNVRTTNVRKDKRQNDKRQKGQTSEATNVRKDKRQKRQTSETTNVRRDKRQKDKRRKNVGKNVRKTSENHNIIYTINMD